MTNELLPCPFCGGEANVRIDTRRMYVECSACPATLGKRPDQDGWPDHHYDNSETAVADWNDRPTPATKGATHD